MDRELTIMLHLPLAFGGLQAWKRSTMGVSGSSRKALSFLVSHPETMAYACPVSPTLKACAVVDDNDPLRLLREFFSSRPGLSFGAVVCYEPSSFWDVPAAESGMSRLLLLCPKETLDAQRNNSEELGGW